MMTAGAAYVLSLVLSTSSGGRTEVMHLAGLPTYAECLRTGARYLDPLIPLGFFGVYICDRQVPTVLIAKAPPR